MTPEQIKEMSDKAMQSLYTAIMDGKITTVQGMCQVMDACETYHSMYHGKYAESDTMVDHL